jgi:hypothetical protein
LGDHIKKEMGKACGMYEGMRGSYGVLVGRPDGKRPLRRPEYK